MPKYWVVRQGTGGVNAQEMIEAGYLGVDFVGDYDIQPHLGAGSDAFRAAMNGVFQGMYPEASRIAAGLAMGNLHAACESIAEGDVVLAPKPGRSYQYGTVTSGYEYHPGTEFPHRRRVDWKGSLSRDDMSPVLAASAGSMMTVFQLTAHKVELAQLTNLSDAAQPIVEALASEVEEQLAFQMGKQLEDFLVHNWHSTSLGREYDIHEVDGSRASSCRRIPARWTSSPLARTGRGCSSSTETSTGQRHRGRPDPALHGLRPGDAARAGPERGGSDHRSGRR